MTTAALDKAEEALRAGRMADACALLEAALAGELDNGARAEALSMLGMARLSGENPSEAVEPLARAVELDPHEGMFRYNHAMGLELAGRIAEAIEEHREAVRLSNGMPQLTFALVRALMKGGQFAEAVQRIAPLATAPGAPAQIRLLHVEALRGNGDLYAAWDAIQPLIPAKITSADQAGRNVALLAARIASDAQYHEEAERLARELLQRDPGDGEAAAVLTPLVLWTNGSKAARGIIDEAIERGGSSPELLVQLLGFGKQASDSALEQAERQARDETVHPYQRSQLLMALAQYHDRTGDPEAAWDFAEKGNALSPKGPRRDWREILQNQLSIYRNGTHGGKGDGGPKHLYLCGAPRSGQSLVQSILAASPEVASLGERGALLPHLLDRSAALRSMDAMERAALFAQLAEADSKGIGRQAGEASWVVDKNPAQIVVAGSIASIHPEARFAASLRDPADIAISIYMRGFSPFYDYATDLAAIIDHLELIGDAVAAWREEGLAIKALSHERLVEDPDTQAKVLFDWLGLPWEKTYLDPASRKTPVPTFSAAQVREPIRRDISRGSTPYAGRLEPFAEQLDRIRAKQAKLLADN